MVMSPEDLVDVSLTSLSMGELFCFPLLESADAWERASRAIKDIGHTALSATPAARYRRRDA
jgi:hypothetical protein